MKKQLFLLLLPLISWQILLAQDGYTLTIERDSDCVPTCVIATEDNEVIAVINRFGTETGISELIRIDASGNITDSLIFSSMSNRFYRIIQIGQSIHEETYFGLGWQWSDSEDSHRYLWVFEFDGEFNIHWEEVIDTINASPTFAQFRHWNNHYFIGIFIQEMGASGTTYLYKATKFGELLKKVAIPFPEEPSPSSANPVFYIRQIPETSHFLMNRHLIDFYTAVIDDDFNYLYTIQPTIYPNQNPNMRMALDLEFFNNTEFIRSGRIEKKQSDSRMLLAVKKMDTASRNDAQIRKFGYEGFEEGNGCHPGAFKALAMHPDYFFVGGFAYNFPSPYSNCDNFIMAYAFNYDLDSLWSTNIGNDAYYVLYYVSPTPDGGCVLAASRYDWRKGDEKITAFIVKLPKPDFPTESIPETDNSKPFVSVFPNPGNNVFLIQTELTNFTLQLYDLQGQLLLTQQNRKEVDTGKLPSGCYIYRIIAENGMTANGKWMKN